MNRILRILLVLTFVAVFSGTYFGCSSSSKKDSTSKTHQHGQGGGCGH